MVHAQVKVGGSIFGGGEAAIVTGNDSVMIQGRITDTILGSVYGGGEGSEATVQGNAYVSVSNGLVLANVYGGGALAQVDHDATVNISGGEVGLVGYTHQNGHTGAFDSVYHVEYDAVNHLVGGFVFGGGKGSNADKDAGWVKGNVNVNISGGHVQYSVYGGGEMASVGSVSGSTLIQGIAKVTVTGGQVGPAPMLLKKNGSSSTEYDSINIACGLNGHDGFVFGGGKGQGDDESEQYKTFTNVNYACVEVKIPANLNTETNRIWGSIFGGAEDGHVLGSDTVKYISGLTGTYGTSGYDGHIFGGGRNFSKKNFTAGRTGGNNIVDMIGGQIYGNIYGGGSYALTGIDKNGDMQAGDHGLAKVMMRGGVVGNDSVIETFTDYSMGNIYGGGKGYLDDKTGSTSAETILKLGLTKNTVVEISDTLQQNTHVYGIVLGGGEIANVGNYTLTKDGGNITNIAVTEGKAMVKISGGIIGGDKSQMRYELASDDPSEFWLKYNDDLGYVYGGGEGWSANPNNYEMVGDTSLLDLISTVQTTEVTITNDTTALGVHRPWVKASVFGGAESGHVMGNTKVTIKGGQIGAGYYVINNQIVDSLYAESQFVRPDTVDLDQHHNLALEGTAHWDYGKTYQPGTSGEVVLYKPFDPVLLKQDTIPSDGKSWFGNVFGGGSGWFPYQEYNTTTNRYESCWNALSGKVYGNTEVIIEGGHILNNVYGANESTDVGGKAIVRMSGGTVGVPRFSDSIDARPLAGYIFGGGSGDPRSIFDNLTLVDSTNVQITGGVVYGSVFGGAEDGHIVGDTRVNIGQSEGKTTVIGSSSESVNNGNIYGGGRNLMASNFCAGRAGGNSDVNMTGGQLIGSIYGGGQNGILLGNTLVTVSGGTVGKNVYGGGRGAAIHDTLGGVKNTEVNITQALGNTTLVKGSVFGGGEIATVGWRTNLTTFRSGTGLAKVNLSGGQVGEEQYGVSQVDIVGGNVYGGGLGLAGGMVALPFANVDSTKVNISDSVYIIGSVFGGGDNGHVMGSTVITMTGGTVGQKNTLAEFITDSLEQTKEHIYCGSILAGGRGTTPVATTPNLVYNDTTGRVFGNTNVTITGGTVRHAVYGGGGLSSIGTYTINPSTGFLPNFTSGGKAYVTVSDSALIGPKQEDLTEPTSEDLAAASIALGTTVDAEKYKNEAFKYLGGNAGWVFGAGCGLAGDDYTRLTACDSTFVNISGMAQVVGSVYGGGENAQTIGSTTVNVVGGIIGGLPLHGAEDFLVDTGEYKGVTVRLADQDSEISEDEYGVGRYVFRGNVYGGGKGTDTIDAPGSAYVYHLAAGRVYGNTHVTISDSALIYNRVYGGGSLASVGSYSYEHTPQDPWTFNDSIIGVKRRGNTGITNVTVTGGQIGTDGNNNGDVYGGGRGIAGASGSPLLQLAFAGVTNVTISDDASIKSNVYGGSANGHVYSDAHVTISGGSIGDTLATGVVHGGWHSNVYGGGGGTNRYVKPNGDKRLSITSGRVYGDSYVNITGGRVWQNVYGGGAIASVGTYDNTSFTRPYLANGHSTVTITGGTIGNKGDSEGMVFGSGRGLIDSVGAFLDSLTYAAYSTVNIGKNSGGTNEDLWVKGSVFGAGENGHSYLESVVNVYSGTIGCKKEEYEALASDQNWKENVFRFRGNVYGAGYGADTLPDGSYNPMSGITQGNTKVNIHGGYISHNVYGGGAMASVGVFTIVDTLVNPNEESALSWPYKFNYLSIPDGNGNPVTTGKAEVTVTGGHIGTYAEGDMFALGKSGSVFGSSRGKAGNSYTFVPLGNVRETEVHVNYTDPVYTPGQGNLIVNSVYGGGENGHVYENTKVTIDAGLIGGSVMGGGKGTDLYSDTLWITTDNGATHTVKQDTLVHSITAGKVFGNTEVVINDGVVQHNVFGGGEYASVGKGNYMDYGENGLTADTTGSGHCVVRIYGGTIGTNGYLDEYGIGNGNVYGSSKGITFPLIQAKPRFNYSHDFFMGYANKTYVTIGDGTHEPRIYGSVFGGGENGHVRFDTYVNVESGEIGVQYDPTDGAITDAKWKYRGNVYGAGRGIDTIPNPTTDFFCSSAGSVTCNTNVTINGGLIHRDVYGGGSLAIVGPPPGYSGVSISTVNINDGVIGDFTGVAYQYGGNVYGSSRGEIAAEGNELDNLATVKRAIVNIGSTDGTNLLGNALVNASVYGSGENGHVSTDATVNIYSGRIGDIKQIKNEYCGNVYGAGSGTDTLSDGSYNPMAGIVKGNTTINMYGGWVMRNIYGGGEVASVGTVDSTHIHGNDPTVSNEYHPLNLSWPYFIRYAENTGTATVNITGGRVGVTGKHYEGEKDWDNGDVYGGSKGVALPVYREARMANVNKAIVNIDISASVTPQNYCNDSSLYCIAGAVYGGGENGHVIDSTSINLHNGLVGHAIYGGGKGKGKYKKQYSITAGKVYGNTHVNVNGGYVVRSVFGGGNLASVGKGNYIGLTNGESQVHGVDSTAVANSGMTFVNIYGGTLGMVYPDNPDTVFKDFVPYGSVFGGCRGKVVNPSSEHRYGFVNNTYVTIGDSMANNPTIQPHIFGSVYGGAQDGHVRHNTKVSINYGEIGVAYGDTATALGTMGDYKYDSLNWTERGNVFGGGSGIGWYDENIPGSYNKEAGSVMDSARVVVKGGRIHRSVYGGGNLASVGCDPVIIISDTAHIGSNGDVNGPYTLVGRNSRDVDTIYFSYGGNVFGAGKGFAIDTLTQYCNVPNTHITVKGGRIYGDVYGGGENGHVTGNTNVAITTGANIGVDAPYGGTTTFDGNVFGGGMGSGHYDSNNNDEFRIYWDCGRVGGNTNITMDGGAIQGTIYGGGRLALVGVDENGEPYANSTTHVYDSTNHGLATILVSGVTDTIPSNSDPSVDSVIYLTSIGNPNGDQLLNGSDESVGDIFGSGKGDIQNYEDIMAGRVANTKITLTGSPRIYGSVFGGGEMAGIGYRYKENGKSIFYSYSGASEVTIGTSATDNPVIGTDMEFWADYASGDPSYWTVYGSDGKLIHTCTGNVYGGAQGDVDTISPHWVSMAGSRTSKVVINGGTIKSRVFGGAEQGTLAGDAYVYVNGGTIGSWANTDDTDSDNDYLFGGVYGGGYGSHNPIFNGTTMHNGDAIVNDSTANLETLYPTQHLWTANYLAGRVYGNTYVELLGGLIQGDVFGGASFAYIGGYGTSSKGNATLAIGNSGQTANNEGVTILGDVFGANNYNGTPLGNILVDIYHTAHTVDNICPAIGSVDDLHNLSTEDQYFALHHVFAGGNLAKYVPQSVGRADSGKSTTVYVHKCDNTIKELFGGGNVADVGVETLKADTYVIVEGGRIHHVYGGGQGDNSVTPAVSANTYGTAHTEIKGGYIDAVFGGGNQSGSVLETNLVINDVSECGMLVDSIFGGSNEAPIEGDVITTIAGCGGVYENIYGGANNASIEGNVTLNILGNDITNVFGGSKGTPDAPGTPGKPANIIGNVTLNLHGGDITNAYGGNDLNGNVTGVITVNVFDTVASCPLSIDTLYGGSRKTVLTAENSAQISPIVNLIHGTVACNVFGGSKGIEAITTSNPMVNIGYDSVTMKNVISDTLYKILRNFTTVDSVRGNVYGGGDMADVIGNTTVNINKGVVGVVLYDFKSNNIAHTVYDTIIHVANSGMVFGGSRGRAINIAYDDTIALVTGDSRVNIKGGKVLYNVYGGGELSSVTDSSFVTVTGGQVGPAPVLVKSQLNASNDSINIPIGLNGLDGYVFGGGEGVGNDSPGQYYKYANVNHTLVTVAMKNPVTHEDSINNRIWGSIFGGAEDGHVRGNANVRYVSGLMGTTGTTSYDGNIFGGGRNYSKKNYTAGRVGGDIKVEMSGGQIYGSIFGGGRLALAGVNERGEQIPGDSHGNVKVVVKGGKVGNEKLIDTWTSTSMGDVYGGGKGSMKGLDGHPQASALLVALTRNTEIVIQDSIDGNTLVSRPVIYGSVYGGGEVANVGYFDWDTIVNPKTNKLDIANIDFLKGGGHTKITVSGGQIGPDRMQQRSELVPGTYNLKFNDDLGHVYGGGEGLAANPALYDTINPKATITDPIHHTATLNPAGPNDIHNYKSLLDLMATVYSTEVIVSDSAWVKGAVYGGSAQGHVMGNTSVKIQGGQIGAGHGEIVDLRYREEDFTLDSLAECVHWPYGDVHGNYVPHDPVYVHSDSLPSDGRSWFGNVFGGGSGYYPYVVNDSSIWNPESGKVYGKAYVEITGGHILTSVYGGCEITDVVDSTIVIMRDGTVGVPRKLRQIENHPVTCNLYGGGKGDPRINFNTYTNVKNARVEVSGGWIYGSVFGGAEDGHVVDSVLLTIKGTAKIGTLGYSSYDGNVFGAGRGFAGDAFTAGTVGGNVTVNIEGGEMLGSVYGGGRLASVGTHLVPVSSINYGMMQNGTEHGYVTVNISGGTIGNDYEAIYHTDFSKHTKGGNVYGGSMGRLNKLNGEVNPIWPNFAKVKESEVNISGPAIIKGNVYGGGEYGTVEQNTSVSVSDGEIWRDVYGGGYGSDNTNSFGYFYYTKVNGDRDTTQVSPMYWAGRVEGNTSIDISNGWVKKNVYGGGELASIGFYADTTLHNESHPFNISWPVEFIYKANTGKAEISVTGGRIGITGKDYMGPWNASGEPYNPSTNTALTLAEIKEAKEDNGDIYGGGKGKAFERYTEAFLANVDTAKISIVYTNPATINDYLDTTAVNRKGCILGAVYGGGENGHVNHDTYITLTKGLVGHAIYGGGKGKGKYQPNPSSPKQYSLTAGKVYGNTHITINATDNEDVRVVRSVFGGGNLASVGIGNYAGGWGDYNTQGYGEIVANETQWNDTTNTGHTYINITGGTLGMLCPSYPDSAYKDTIPYGSVFGGCRGMAVADTTPLNQANLASRPDLFLSYVNHTHVTIGTENATTGPRLYGSIYGGSQDGHVRWNTNVTVNSGEVGANFGTNQVSNDDAINNDPTDRNWVDRGNVFGGGSGMGLYDSNGDKIDDALSTFSGSVLQNTNVTIKGGTIHRNVYGGGSLSTVGPPRLTKTYDCPIDTTCATVNIYGRIGENTVAGYGGYVYGGAKGLANPDAEGFIYKDFAYTPYTRVNLNDGAYVYHDVFGGGENGQIGSSYSGDTLHTAEINIYDGAEIGGSVFGGGQGTWGLADYLNDTISGRVMGSTRVNLNNSQVVGNIYGGGALGVVMDSAVVVIAGGEVHDVFGAGRGYETRERQGNADVVTATRVDINGGVVHGAVFGGGENGTVGFLAREDVTVTTNVNLNGGHVETSAYGGGKLGFSRGGTFMNVSGTSLVDQNVFGGAYGRQDTVFVAGLHTVNMRGGTVGGSVYGGSYNADDALVFTPRPFNDNDTIESACVVNYSGGHTNYNVFGAGYFGKTYGSTYVFIGTKAITSAPNHIPMAAPYDEAYFSNHKDLVINRDIWSGADFGTVEPGTGSTFGGPTVTGRSDIYIDGYGYDTEHSESQGNNLFMNIGTSSYKGNVFGCGTMNDGGRAGKIIMIRNYGKDVATVGGGTDPEPWASATRTLYSIQHADKLILDSTHVKLEGRGIVSVLSTTSEPYAIFDIMDTVRVVNGSSLYIDKPIENIGSLFSCVGSNLYDNPIYTPVEYGQLAPNHESPDPRYDNKFRINQGTHISVNMAQNNGSGIYYTYGELSGFFHMMTDGEFNAYAYARPKNSTVAGNGVFEEHDNPNDGGFVSYRGEGYNTFSEVGDSITGPFIQMPYENHTPKQNGSRQGEAYYRVWRYYKSALSVLDVQLIAIASSTDGFTSYKPLRAVLLPPGNVGDYYKVKKKTETVTDINYGSEIKMVNAGVKESISSDWMYSDGTDFHYVTSSDDHLTSGKNFMKAHPNNAFGLTMIPEGGFAPLTGVIKADTALICIEANTPLVNSLWNICQSAQPQFDFRLTHYNKITGNFKWDPISIPLEHYNSEGQLIGEVEIRVTITTKTSIEQDNDIDTYALMVHTQSGSGEGGGDHHDVYSAKVMLPTYEPYSGTESIWTLKEVKWIPNTHQGFDEYTLVAGEPYPGHDPTSDYVGMTMYPTINYDNSNGWLTMTSDTLDLGDIRVDGANPIPTPYTLGKVDPRKPFSFQFDLHYDSKQNVGEDGNDTIGRVEVTAHFTNYQSADGRDVKFNVYVHRRGKGRGFYIDGVNGDFVYSGHYPNAAQPSLAGIFYFTDYEPSDTIYIVNKVTADAVDQLNWDGREYNQVTIFRYNGGHPLYTEGGVGTHYEDYDVTNNPAYKGVLVDVLTSMSIHSIILDGSCLKQELKFKPGSTVDTVAENLLSSEPLIRVNDDAVLNIMGGENTFTSLQNNYNKGTNGGAVDVPFRGTLNMNKNSFMRGNYVKDGDSEQYHGGAIYMGEYSYLLLSDSVMISDNYHVNADTVNENVYIANYNTTISVGTEPDDDDFGPLNAGSRIGVTKTDWNDEEYMPVVYTENKAHGNNLLSNGNYALGQIIYDDESRFGLLEYPFRQSNGDESRLNKLYWVKTWVNVVTEKPNPFRADSIYTPEQLAWTISIVNGLNNETAHPDSCFTIAKDLDMSKYIWRPIGNATTKYNGVFEGNGHLISGIHSPLAEEDKGMFGVTNKEAEIRNLQAIVDFHKGDAYNLGGIVGHMAGGKLYNVESAGYLESSMTTGYIGGLVGKADSTSVIHSCFATDTLSGSKDGMSVGGLVGYLGGSTVSSLLLNSYSFFSLDPEYHKANIVGGLVGTNYTNGRVENCYVHAVGNANKAGRFGWLASVNYGGIRCCYIPDGQTPYINEGYTDTVAFGTFAPVVDRKAIGYMYDDNKVTLSKGHQEGVKDYVADTVVYNKVGIEKWRGMLSSLSQWVKDNDNKGVFDGLHFTPWFRPITTNINGDLPVLAFPKNIAVAVSDHDSLFLKYSNSLDSLLADYSSDVSSIFLYGNATEVQYAPSEIEKVFINEDAVLLPKASAKGDFINTTVGITFDNSGKHSQSYYGDSLEYNWHLMSTPLSDAKMGTTYSHKDTEGNYTPDLVSTYQDSPVDIVSMVNSYFPNGLPMGSGYNSNEGVRWDFYSYFEPEYHWINLKRNKKNHFHQDAKENETIYVGRPSQPDRENGWPHYQINYTEADQALNSAGDDNCVFIPGKGYMMAISQDSYMNSTGTLNAGNVPVRITALAPPDDPGYASHDKGSNLVGNPYQAYLDLDSVSNTPYKNFWVYDADSVSTGVHGLYLPYTMSASTNHVLPSRYLHPHQGFFVVMDQSVEVDTLTFTPNMATTDNTPQSYFRGDQPGQPSYPLVNLFMKDTQGNADLTIVELNRPEVGGVHKIDNLRNANFKFYARFNKEDYGLLFAPEGTERVPLFFKTTYNDNYTLAWEKLNGTFETMYLIDNITGVTYDMLTHDHYTFEGRASDFAARFYIVFSIPDDPEPGEPGDEPGDDDDIFAYYDGNGWVVNGTGQLELVDMLGRVLYTKHLDGRPTMVHFDDFAASTYMLRLVNNKKILKTQKIVIY